MILVRRYRSTDAGEVAFIQNATRKGAFYSEVEMRGHMQDLINSGGFAWVLHQDGLLSGFAMLAPVPGLKGVYELDGGVTPSRQRMGHGSLLLNTLQYDLLDADVQQLFFSVDSLESPVALFLNKHEFFVEHEEWRMELDDLSQVSPVQYPQGFLTRSYSQGSAIRRFLKLYETCFADLPWYQPYGSASEVAADLEDTGDILFLMEGREEVGFMWLRWPETGIVEVEPIGVSPDHQGLGLGKIMLQNGLSLAAQQGAESAILGVWIENTPALTLYECLGFCRVKKISFLAMNVSQK